MLKFIIKMFLILSAKTAIKNLLYRLKYVYFWAYISILAYINCVGDAFLLRWDHSQLDTKALLLLRSDACKTMNVIDRTDLYL